MLDWDYSTLVEKLLDEVGCEITLPLTWSNFFQQSGPLPSAPGDKRRHQRVRVRVPGLMYFEQRLPCLDRPCVPTMIFTADFSRRGVGLIAAEQIYPEEVLRIVLPTFWGTIRVVRCHLIGESCYSVGGRLIARRDPDVKAFELPRRATAQAC